MLRKEVTGGWTVRKYLTTVSAVVVILVCLGRTQKTTTLHHPKNKDLDEHQTCIITCNSVVDD